MSYKDRLRRIKQVERVIIFTIGFILIAVFPIQADQEDEAKSAYDLRMEYTEGLVQQDAYNSRMEYYEEMAQNTSIRNQIVDYALSFVGVTPYVHGGGDLWTGTDCSGFVYLIFGTFGYWLATNSDAYQDWIGYHVSWEEILPGDIIVYGNGAHVGIYAGYGCVVHCSSEENGTVCWPVDYRSDASAIVRVIG